ncbi:hypothetical protein BB559_004113 [Furculomyces boomerangus]|uniref:ER membrane protein complex subunit 2 n=2 Tax=Harpellales TaxID=61421 RepID=A0A2T9YGN0_9FUNG|nr:hypothetical protein BB559_004113 [Furculomyces boomerangus]PVZ97427.1 hypothetical protein BB558_006611 [Smittium angustum]PVZ99317.1 hypothetical protein BB558_004654 [Smittium angustum]
MKYSTTECLERLESIRLSGERRSQEVVEIGEILERSNTIPKTDEGWMILEQIAIGGMDTGKFELANACIQKLKQMFSQSKRVRMLECMYLEANGWYNEALDEYNKSLELDPTDMNIPKRKIAILIAQNDISSAIKALLQHVDNFPNDLESWIKLSQLYLDEHLYPQAAYCIEELILMNPVNHFYHLKYAEIQYTLGNIEMALKYYLSVVELSRDNVQGFYGVKLCSDRLMQNISSSKKTLDSARGLKNKNTLSELSQLATERLLFAYSNPSATSEKLIYKDDKDIEEKPTPMTKLVLESWLKL